MPAASAQDLVFAWAESDQTAGTVMMYSMGVVRKILDGSLNLSTSSV